MRTITIVSIASLFVSCATCAYAQEGTPAASLDAPIATMQLDPAGNITRITFTNGASLDSPQIDSESLEGLKIEGIRRLPFELLQVGDPANPQMVVVADFVGTTPVLVPSGAGAVLSVHPDGEVSLSVSDDIRLGCRPGCYPMGGDCICPPSTSSVLFPMLVETFDPETSEFKVQVLMSEVPVGKP